MKVTITGNRVDVTDSIRQHANDKIGPLDRFYDRVHTIDVVLTKPDQLHYQTELIAHVNGHSHIVAHAKNENVHATIDDAAKKMERQLHEEKEKRRNRKH
jgi:putative sigma-54 modulation protein